MRFEVRVTPEMVDAVATARITARYSLTRQINALRGAADDVDFNWIDAVRDAARALKAMPVIPPDYAADRHWPPA